MKVHWSPRALRDADEAASYIAGDRPGAAEQWVTGLFDAVQRLEQFALSGRTVPFSGTRQCREVLYGSHQVIYRAGRQRVEIVTMMHVRRKLGPEHL